MKDLNDPHTPDLFGSIQPPGRSPVKTPRQKYYNPGNKRLDMWVSPRCSVQLDDLARLRGCTKRQLVEDLLEQASAGSQSGDDAGGVAGDGIDAISTSS